MAAKKIMVQGTMSNSGKSFLVAALCRIFTQDGYKTAPFKSQNMALNSYITKEGLEMGRAQVMQAEAAGIEPSVDMNPILLKPTSRMGSQVIVGGEVFGNLQAMEYYRRKPEFIPYIQAAFSRLEAEYDIIVLEGAGSPAEINLRDHDIVNMGMAKMAQAPVILVGDIDRGGVFASLYGTVQLLEPEERARIKGLVINKFRGDKRILQSGLTMIEERLNIPVIGVIPMEELDLEDEDSLSERLGPGQGTRAWARGGKDGLGVKGAEGIGAGEDGFEAKGAGGEGTGVEGAGAEGARAKDMGAERINIAVIHFPHISNFTDFNSLERLEGVALRYVGRVAQLGQPDLVILPGTKNTMADLQWMRELGLEARLKQLVGQQVPIIGICGGFQMLGNWLADPDGVEGGGRMAGMGLLNIRTIFRDRKTRARIAGKLLAGSQMFGTGAPGSGDDGLGITGYEIHMGETEWDGGGANDCPFIMLENGRSDGFERRDGLVFGSYLHGLFDNPALAVGLVRRLGEKKGIDIGAAMFDPEMYKQEQFDKLANLVRGSLDMEAVYQILEFQEGIQE